jgi:hypothetical protein
MKETDMAEKKPKTPKTKAAKKTEPKPTRERKPKEEGLVVFALRMSEPERVALHEAAGPAQASRVMRALAVAFANEVEAAFKAALAEARKLRA